MTDHPAPLSHRESAATPTDTKNEAQAAQRPLQRESGHILDETQVRIIRKNAEVVRRSPERAASYTDLVLYQLDSLADSHEALRASHAALTARLAAVVGERALLITVAEWASTLRRRAQSHEDERLYDQAVARLDGALYALMRYRQARRLEPPDGR